MEDSEKLEIESLFEEAFVALDNIAETSFECAPITFQQSLEHEKITILFDLALESLEDPTAQAKYVKDVPQGATTELESKIIKTQLKQTEEALSKSLQAQKISELRREELPTNPVTPSRFSPQKPRTMHRFCAFLIDSTLVLLFSLIGGGALLTLVEGIPIFSAKNTNDPLLFLALSYLWLTFLFFTIFYPLLTTLLFDNTLGGKIFRYNIIGSDGSKPSKYAVFTRSVLFFPSLCLGSWIAPLIGKNSFHDTISGLTLNSTIKKRRRNRR
ncbi:MAG: RDD family protein [Bdellovibrionota bacterium]|jgi:hypothetical protein